MINDSENETKPGQPAEPPKEPPPREIEEKSWPPGKSEAKGGTK